MKLTEDLKRAIEAEYKEFEAQQYAGKSKSERQKLGQFYTPPPLSIKMLEKFDSVKDKDILDPTAGAGGLLVACILAGADPKRVYGIELDPETAEVCRKRLTKYGVPPEHIRVGNALDSDAYDFDGSSEVHDLNAAEIVIDGDDVVVSILKFPCKYLKQVKFSRSKLNAAIEKFVAKGLWIVCTEDIGSPESKTLKTTSEKIAQIAKKQKLNSFDDLVHFVSKKPEKLKKQKALKMPHKKPAEYVPSDGPGIVGRSYDLLVAVIGEGASKSFIWHAWCEEAKAAYARYNTWKVGKPADEVKKMHDEYLAWKKTVIGRYNATFSSNMR